jgi:hypothetical protein
MRETMHAEVERQWAETHAAVRPRREIIKFLCHFNIKNGY